MIKRKSHPVCPFCKSDETIPLTNYGKQINNHFQCLDCKKQWCNKCKQRRVDCECGKVLKRKNPYRKDETNNGLNLEKYRKSYDKGYLQGLINGLQKLDYITWPAINHSSIVSRIEFHRIEGYYKGLWDSIQQLKLIPKNKLKSYIKELEEEIDAL